MTLDVAPAVSGYCVSVLEGARRRIADYRSWLVAYMWDEIGGRDCYCAAGAVLAAAHIQPLYEGPDSWPATLRPAIDALNAAARQIDPEGATRDTSVDAFISVNDTGRTPHNHGIVLRTFDRAIQLLREGTE